MNNLQQEIIDKLAKEHLEIFPVDGIQLWSAHGWWLEKIKQSLEAVRLATLEEVEKAIKDEYKSFGWDDGNGNYASEAVKKLKEEKKR